LIAELWTGIFTLAGVIITVAVGNSKTIYRIEQLEKRVNEHNNIVFRLYKAEKEIAILREKAEEN
jgi:hypothetical protein